MHIGGGHMRLRKSVLVVIILLAIMGVTYQFAKTDYTGPEFIEEPIQENLDRPEIITIEGEKGSVDLELLATYQIDAIVKSTKNYTTDFTSQISPRDFALAWGDINIPSIDRHIDYSQRNRWYYFTVGSEAGVDVRYVDQHSANTHIIPANEYVKLLVEKVKVDDYITLEGYLVDANFEGGYWNTSLTRNDTGDGSCEIMYVTNIIVHEE